MRILTALFIFCLFGLLGGCAEDRTIAPPAESPEVAAARELVEELSGQGIFLRNPDGTTKTLMGESVYPGWGDGDQILLTDGGIDCGVDETIYVDDQHSFVASIGRLPGGKHYAHSIYYRLAPREYVINGICYLDLTDPVYAYNPDTGEIDEAASAAGCREVLNRYPSTLTIVDWNDEIVSGTITARFHKNPHSGTAETIPSVGVDDLALFGDVTIVFKVAAPVQCN